MKEMQKNPEFKRIQDELQTSGKAFSAKFKTRMFDVLNDEQWARLQLLIDNPPPYAKVLLQKIREQSGQAEQSGGGWVPGPNSWKPGDPIPEEYRQKRNTPGNLPRPKPQ
jgi:Ni/Co efflux regulator RcnB